MKTAIVYSHSATKTKQVANLIKQALGREIDDLDIETIEIGRIKDYDLLILGAPTWFDGELPNYWDEKVPYLEDLELAHHKVAIFGNGDQIGYPQNFGDAVGLLAEVFESSGAVIVGQTSTDGYQFESSKALRGNRFLGLILDFEHQVKMNKQRVSDWVYSIENQQVN